MDEEPNPGRAAWGHTWLQHLDPASDRGQVLELIPCTLFTARWLKRCPVKLEHGDVKDN